MPARLRPASPHRRTAAMTLLEVMISMAIFTAASMGLMATSLAARRLAQGNLQAMSAQVCAQAYMEQLKGTGYGNLGVSPIVTRLAANAQASDTLVPHSALDIWPADTDRTGANSKLLNLSNSATSGSELLVQFNPVITTAATASSLKYYSITLQYRWQSNHLISGEKRWRTNSLTSIRSSVQSY